MDGNLARRACADDGQSAALEGVAAVGGVLILVFRVAAENAHQLAAVHQAGQLVAGVRHAFAVCVDDGDIEVA